MALDFDVFFTRTRPAFHACVTADADDCSQPDKAFIRKPTERNAMQTETYTTETDRYARCVDISKRIRWDIDEDVIRGRKFDFGQKFLPDALSKVDQIDFYLR